MTYADLEKLRWKAPFIVTGLCALPFWIISSTKSTGNTWLDQLIVTGIAMGLTYLYVSFDARDTVWSRETDLAGEQIRSALLELVPPDLQVTESERAQLAEKDIFKRLTGVFWEAVGRDAELSAHKPHFYANGAKYTTVIDIMLITAISGCVYLLLHLVTNNHGYAWTGFGLIVLSFFCQFISLPKVRAKHLALSKEQLDLLRRNQKDYVQSRFREIVAQRRLEASRGE